MYFSTRLNELNKNNDKPTSSTASQAKQGNNDDKISSITFDAAADRTVLGHAFFGETKACAKSAAACAGHCQPLVRQQPGTIWPCWRVRDVGTMTDDQIPVSPVMFGIIPDQYRVAAPMYLVGYVGGEPVHSTTNTLATDHKAYVPGSYQMQWPVLIPGMVVAECAAVASMATDQGTCTNVNKDM